MGRCFQVRAVMIVHGQAANRQCRHMRWEAPRPVQYCRLVPCCRQPSCHIMHMLNIPSCLVVLRPSRSHPAGLVKHVFGQKNCFGCFLSQCPCLMPLPADLNQVLDDSCTLDDNTRKALKRRLNPAVDLAAAAEDRMTADGYGLAHNPVRSEVVSSLASHPWLSVEARFSPLRSVLTICTNKPTAKVIDSLREVLSCGC